MFYDSKIGNKSVSYRLNDPELNEEEKMKWLAEQKFASQSEYYSPYNYDAQKNFINGISNELISKSNESYAYRYGIASAIATLQGISVDQVLQNYDAYKAMYTGGVDLDDKSFASAFADSWKSESANRKIASLQNKYDKSTDEEYKEYLLEQIEKAEHDAGMLTHHQSFGTVGNAVVSSAPILRQGLRTAALSYAGGLAFSTLSMLATGTSLAGAAMNNFAWANTLLTASQNAITKGGIKAVGGKLLGKAVTAVANPFNLGSTAGTLIDAYQNVYQTERGLLSRDIYNITDEYGNRVDDETRNRWSSIGGALIAFAEYMTPEPFLNRKMGGARFQQIAGDSAYAMVIDYVKNVALGAHSESVEEAVQSIIGDVAKDIALKTSKDGKFDVSIADNIGSYLTNAMDSYLQAFGPSLIAGGVGNLAGALVNTAEDSIFSMKDGKGVTMKETLHNFRNNFMASNGSMLTESQVINKVNTVQKPTNANTSKVLDKQFYDTEDVKLTKQEIEEYNNKYSTPESVPTVLVRYDETTNSFKALNEENGKLAKYLLYTKKLPGMYVDVVKNENIVMTEDQIYNQSYNGGGTYNADEDTITFNDYDSAMEFAKTTGNYGVSFGNSNTADITVNMDDGTERTITLKVGNETENQEVNVDENNNSIDSIDSTKSTQQNGVKAVVSEDNGNQYKVFDVEAIKAELSNVDLNMSQEELDNALGYVSSLPDYVQNDIIDRLEKNGMSVSDFITDTESFKKAVGLSGNENTYADKGNAFTIVSEARIVVNNKKAKAKDIVHELFHVVWNLYPQYREQLKATLSKDLASSRGKEKLRQFYIANFDELNTNGNTDTDGRIVGKVKSYDDFMKQAKLCANGGKGYSEIAAEEFMARMATVVLLSPDDSAMAKLPTQTKSIMQKFISAMKKLYQNLRSEEMPKDLKQAIWSIYDDGNKFTVAEEETVKNYEEKVLNPIDENLRPKSISKEIQKIRDKYESYKSIVGNKKTVTLANGEEVKCHYKLVEADAPTASHNEITFQPTDGFPTNEEGKNINDRDYQNDKDAQQSVIDIANSYDSRALSNPPVVTKDGIVVSGNNRVMSSKRAVANKTDKKYIKSLKEQVEDFGFKEEDLDNFYHPRLVLEINEEHVGDYTTKEFAKYNKDDKKTMSKVNKAISLGKQLTDENIQYLTQNFDSYESMGELYTDAKEIDRLIERLVRLNIISETDKAQYRDTDGSLSNIGKDFLETLLLGSVLNEDNIRRLDSDGIKSLRKKLVRVILPLVENKGLGDDYSINTELNNGVELAVNVLSDRSNGTIDDYVGQQSLLGDKRDYTKNEIYLAKLMTSKNVTELSFASIMKNILQSLSESSSGQMDIFSDGIRSKQEIIDANLLDESMKFRYSGELDDTTLLTDEEIDNRFNGSILDPKNLVGRNIKSWSELRESDVEELVDGNRYVPESVLRNFSDNMFVIKELSDRESMLRLSSRSEDIVDIALGSANADSFIKELRSRDIYTEEEMKEWEGLAEKFMSYVATVTPQEFASFFAEKYGSKTTTLDDLLALKSILGAKRIESGVKGDKKSYEIVSYKSELARTLNSINANSSNTDIRRVADEISANSTEYAKEYAKALVLSDSVANAKESIKGKKFSPYLSSWLMVSLGDSVDNTLMKLRNDSNTVEYDSIQKDYAESENIEETLDSSDVVSSLNGEDNSDMSVNEALREENKKSLDKQIDDLQKTVGRLTKRVDAYKSRIYRYEKLKERAKELRSQNSELFEKVSELQNKLDEATRSASYREWNEEQKFNAEYERLRKTIMYTEMFAKLDQKDLEKKLRAFYNEKLMKMRSVAQLKNSLSYNKNTQDVAYIDPVMKYLYKFINNKNDEYSYITCDDYRNTAMKRGEATEAESTPIVTYDFAFDDRGRVLDYYDVTLDYNPNSDRMDMSAMPKMLEKYLPPELAKKIKSNELKFQDLTSKDVNDIRTALYMVKHISTLSLRQKKAEKQNRRRTSSMNIFNEQMDFSINDLTSEQKRSIDSKIEASGIRDRGQLYTQNELDAMKSNPRNTITNKQREDYIRKNPKALFDTLNENNDKGIGEKFDQAKAMYAKMERVCTWMDGGKEGAIYNNVFRPLYDAYESKLKWVNKRNQNAVERINAILGSDKRTIEANKKALNEKKMFKSNTIDSDSANIELNGWEQIGVYIYAQNIYGFVKLISSGGNNISLEEVARINPVYTKKFVDSALEDRLNNRELLENAKDNKTAPKLTKDILNHVDLDTLLEVQEMLDDGTIPMESSLPEMWTRVGDEMIDILGGRLNEFIQAGYREDNVLITLQDRYFPLYDSGQSNLLVKDKNGKKRVNTRSLNARSMTDNYPLRLNPLVNMFAEIENQEAIINMQSAVNDVHWILDRNGGNLKGVINMKYGKVWGKYFEDYVNMMANGNGNEIEDFDKTINRFIGNIAVSRIGLNLMTSIKQLVSLIPAMTRGELTIPEVLSALRMVTGNNTSASVNDFILENASSVFYSAYNVEAQSALKRDEAVGAGVLKDIREASMWLTEKLDGLVKKTVWLAEYQKQIKKGTRHIDAVSIATQLVENTQSVTDNPSLAKLQMNKNPLVRLSFMFTNDLFQTWNMITYDIPNAIRNGNTKRALMESFGILLQGGVIAFLAGGWLGDEKDDDPWWSDFLGDFAVEGSSYLPIAGPFLQDLVRGYSSSFWQGPQEGVDTLKMIVNQCQYWATDGKMGKDYETPDWVNQAVDVTEELLISPTGAPVLMIDRMLKSMFPDGITEGVTEDANSLWYLLGSKYGKSMYKGVD